MRQRQSRLLFGLFIILCLGTFFFIVCLVKITKIKEPPSDIVCHFTETPLYVPSASDISFKPRSDSIFFHETSCKSLMELSLASSVLRGREACAVESAARQNPNRSVYLLFASPYVWSTRPTEDPLLSILLNYTNVNIARVEMLKYGKGTPLEEFLTSGALFSSSYRVSHASDILRYLTLYKFGGTYLDLDIIVAKNLDDLKEDWSARESDTAVAAGAISMSNNTLMGRLLANKALMELSQDFRGDLWGHNGPGVITRILKETCKTKSVKEFNRKRCHGFEVYPPAIVYPIPYRSWREYFDPKELNKIKHMNKTYMFHMWNNLSKNEQVHPDKEVPFSYLAKRYCPHVYALTNKYF